MTIGRAAADRAGARPGARPYLRRRPSGSVLLSYCFSGCTLRNKALRSVLFWNASWTGVGPNPPYPSAMHKRYMGRSCEWPVELAGELELGQIRRLKTMKKWRVVSNGLNHPGELFITGTAGAELQYERL